MFKEEEKKKLQKIVDEIPDEVKEKARKNIIDTLFFVIDTLEKHNIKYWIEFGTLLGACRQNDLIWFQDGFTYDDDSDISILEEDREKVQNLLINAVKNTKYSFYCCRAHDKKGFFQIRNKKEKKELLIGGPCDIFLWQKKDNILFSPPCERGISRNRRRNAIIDNIYAIDNLETIKFGDREVKCPNNPMKFIENKYRYGEGAINNPKPAIGAGVAVRQGNMIKKHYYKNFNKYW